MKMNKGIVIWQSKKNKKRAETHEAMRVLPEQADICQFVKISYDKFKKVNGKNRFDKRTTVTGLQIRNRVYLADGSYKLINLKRTKVKNVFDGIPDWANNKLIELYHQHTA